MGDLFLEIIMKLVCVESEVAALGPLHNSHSIKLQSDWTEKE